METKDVEANSASAQLAAFISRGGGNHLSEEDLEEELQIKDPGQDVVENFADCAKPQGLHGDSLQATRPCKVQDCSRWSRKDVEDLRVMILDMQVDPEEYPDSASGQYQDQVWPTDPEHFYSTLI